LEDFVVSGSHFFSSCPPNIIIDTIYDYADEECFELEELSKSKFEIRYTFSPEEESSEEESKNE